MSMLFHPKKLKIFRKRLRFTISLSSAFFIIIVLGFFFSGNLSFSKNIIRIQASRLSLSITAAPPHYVTDSFIPKAQAFTGPSSNCTPPNCGGAIQTNSSGDLSVGTTIGSGTKLLVVDTSTDTYGLRVLSAASSPLLIVEDNGQIGINTSSPVYALDVNGDIRTTGNLIAQNYSGLVSAQNVTPGVFDLGNGSGNYSFPSNLGVGTSTNASLPAPLSVYGNGYISGDLEIGTTTISAPLTIEGASGYGQIGFKTTNGSSGGIGISNASSQILIGDSSGQLALWDTGTINFSANGGTIQMVLTNGGNVGIGTTAPLSEFTLEKDAASGLGPVFSLVNAPGGAGSTDAIDFYTYSDGTAPEAEIKTVDDGAYSGNIIFSTKVPGINQSQALTERMRIASNGNVGIGTTSPGSRLTIEGPYNSNQLLVSYDGSNGIFFQADGTTTHYNWQLAQQDLVGGLTFTPSTAVGGTSFTTPVLTLLENGDASIENNLTIGGTLTAGTYTGTLNAANVSAGTFGSNVGNGNFSFPSTLTVGDSAPQAYAELNVWNPTSGSGLSDLADFTNGTDNNLDIYVSQVGAAQKYSEIDSYNTNPLVLNDHHGGNIGIGTVNPLTQLDVAGTARATTGMFAQGTMPTLSSSAGIGIIIDAPGGTYGRIQAYNFGSLSTVPLALQPNGGNVGIETTNPEQPLHVGPTDTSSGDNPSVGIASGNSAAIIEFTNPGFRSAEIGIGSDDYLDLADETGHTLGVQIKTGGTYASGDINSGTPQLTVLDNGQVGIGMTGMYNGVIGSNAKLAISSTDNSQSGIIVGNGTSPRFALNGLSSGGWAIYDGAANNWDEDITANSGNVTIPGNLTVNGTFSGSTLTGTLNAANVSAGTFGSNTGGGNYGFSGALFVGSSAIGNQAGDLGVSRNGSPTTGAIYLGDSSSVYLYYNGSQFYFSGGTVNVPNLGVGGNTVQSGDIMNIGAAADGGDATYQIDGLEVAGRYYGWDKNMLYLDGYSGFTSGVSIGSPGATSVPLYVYGNLGVGGQIVPSTVSDSGGSSWYFGSLAWGGDGPAVTGTDSVTGLVYEAGSGSQLFTLSSNPGQASLQMDGSLFVGDYSSPYNPYSTTGATDGNLVVDDNASIGGNLDVNASVGIYGAGLYNSSGYQIVQTNASDWLRINQGNSWANGTAAYGDWAFGTGGVSIGAWTDIPAGQLSVTGNTTIGGDLTVSGGKITVGTWDPVYDIGGVKYATYGSGMTGVKEETEGTVTLAKHGDKYSYTIDFANLDKGSDLWLFANATNFGSNYDNLSILLTPGFDGSVWYSKDSADNSLTIYGSGAGEVSYRLTAPRFDASKWTNLLPGNESSTPALIVPTSNFSN